MITKLFEEKLKKDLFRLAMLTLITVLIWIGLSTYRALNKSQVKSVVKKQMIPLTPNLDLGTMEDIKKRRRVPTIDWGNLNPDLLASPSVELSSPEATFSNELLE